LTREKQWAIENKFKAIALCFNDYNKNIIEIWKKRRLGEVRTPRTPRHIFYNGMNQVDFAVNIQHTKQWIVYEKLDESFKFDWTSISYVISDYRHPTK